MQMVPNGKLPIGTKKCLEKGDDITMSMMFSTRSFIANKRRPCKEIIYILF